MLIQSQSIVYSFCPSPLEHKSKIRCPAQISERRPHLEHQPLNQGHIKNVHSFSKDLSPKWPPHWVRSFKHYTAHKSHVKRFYGCNSLKWVIHFFFKQGIIKEHFSCLLIVQSVSNGFLFGYLWMQWGNKVHFDVVNPVTRKMIDLLLVV